MKRNETKTNNKDKVSYDIKIVGTPKDVKLIKKIFNFYLKNKASKNEECHIETYLGLIDYAVNKVEESNHE